MSCIRVGALLYCGGQAQSRKQSGRNIRNPEPVSSDAVETGTLDKTLKKKRNRHLLFAGRQSLHQSTNRKSGPTRQPSKTLSEARADVSGIAAEQLIGALPD